MKKQKLAEMRKLKGVSQEQMADTLCMSGPSYSRRESGEIKMTIVEWLKASEALEIPLSEIYESDENQVFIVNDNASPNFLGTNNSTNNIYTIPEALLESQEKYIKKLEEEIATLKSQREKL